ncbi:hypothetical protein HDU97_006783, partial [Phlyctochytrium planicorne]
GGGGSYGNNSYNDRGGSYGDNRGGSRGYDDRGGSYGSRGGYDDRGGSYGSRGGYDDRGGNDRGGYGDSRGGYNQPAPSGGGGGGGKWAAAAQAAESQNANGYGSSGYRGWENVDEEQENYDDEGWLQRKTKKTQMDSLESTRRALAKMEQSESVASSSLNKLNSQSEQLYSIESKLETAEHKAKISEAKTAELKSLNRFFMIPAFGRKKAQKMEERYKQEEEEAAAREAERKGRVQEVLDSNGNYGYHSKFDDDGRRKDGKGRRDDRDQPGDHWNHGKSYTTPEGLERDEVEEEIDQNLDQISSGLARLKMMGRTMNSELDHQSTHINRITDRTDSVRDRVDRVNDKVSKITRKK